MSIIIFFGMALCIFAASMIAISLTFFHWYKVYRDGKTKNSHEQSAEAGSETSP